MPVAERDCQFLQAEILFTSLCVFSLSELCALPHPPRHHCLASSLSSLMNYIFLHPGHLFPADPKPPTPVPVGDFPPSSPSPSLSLASQTRTLCAVSHGHCSLLSSVPPRPGCPQQQDRERHLLLVLFNSRALVQMCSVKVKYLKYFFLVTVMPFLLSLFFSFSKWVFFFCCSSPLVA